jgi:uncharacterized membrane protein YhaH (DUF805 family)
MSFGQSISTVYRNYATFSGRASRPEFWWWYLFYIIIAIVVYLIDQALPIVTIPEQSYDIGGQLVMLPAIKYGILSPLWFLANLIPFLAVGCRRLHDSGRTGWWLLWGYLLSCLCGIGAILLIVFWCLSPTPGPNRYGPQPGTAI